MVLVKYKVRARQEGRVRMRMRRGRTGMVCMALEEREGRERGKNESL